MARADILEKPPEFMPEHLDWLDAHIKILEAAAFGVSVDANIVTEVNKVKGAKVIRTLIAANIAQRSPS